MFQQLVQGLGNLQMTGQNTFRSDVGEEQSPFAQQTISASDVSQQNLFKDYEQSPSVESTAPVSLAPS